MTRNWTGSIGEMAAFVWRRRAVAAAEDRRLAAHDHGMDLVLTGARSALLVLLVLCLAMCLAATRTFGASRARTTASVDPERAATPGGRVAA